MSETETTQGRFPGERRPILQSADDIFEIAVKLGLFFFLVYWSTVLLRPFLSIALWSLILAVALYPAFSWAARLLGGRRKLAAVLVTTISLLVFTGPIIWLGISMIEGVAELSRRFSAGDIAIPPPSEEIKHCAVHRRAAVPLMGPRFHKFKERDYGSASLSFTVPEHGAQNG